MKLTIRNRVRPGRIRCLISRYTWIRKRFEIKKSSALVSTKGLSQINLSIISFNVTVHLATGAYGWWKARNRSQSLIEVLDSSHCQLSSNATFNRDAYAAARLGCQMRAVALDAGRLHTVELPKASTGLDRDLGLVCLRALITAILCLFDVAATTSIRAEVIPDKLVNYH